jgi:hypothetical protein
MSKNKNATLQWVDDILAEANSPLDKRFIELFLEFLAIKMELPPLTKKPEDWDEINMVSTLVYLWLLLFDLGESLKEEAVTDAILLEEVNHLFDSDFAFSVEYLITHRKGYTAIGEATTIIIQEPKADRMVQYCRDAYALGRKTTFLEELK